jgi:hypothetical protein
VLRKTIATAPKTPIAQSRPTARTVQERRVDTPPTGWKDTYKGGPRELMARLDAMLAKLHHAANEAANGSHTPPRKK